MNRYAKAVVALFTALGTWGTTALADGNITGPEWFGLCGVAAAAAAVYTIPNRAT